MFREKIKQIMMLLIVSLFITACQTTSNETQQKEEIITTDKDPRKGECRYIQRNLTVTWGKEVIGVYLNKSQ